MKQKVIIFGSTGMLGRYVYCYLSRSGKYDISCINRVDLQEVLNNDKPFDYSKLYDFKMYIKDLLIKKGCVANTYVFNGIGLIPQAGIKNGGGGGVGSGGGGVGSGGGGAGNGGKQMGVLTVEYYDLVNHIFPWCVDIICGELNAKFIHPTTDCIYSGRKGRYIEDDECDVDINYAYGRSKYMGECRIYNGMVIRCSIIGEELGKKCSLVEWIRSNGRGSVIKGFENHLWNGITCLQYAKIIEEIIEKGIHWYGVRHLFSPTVVSKADIIDMVNSVYKLGLVVIRVSEGDKCDRSLGSVHKLLFDIPELLVQIREMAKFDIGLE